MNEYNDEYEIRAIMYAKAADIVYTTSPDAYFLLMNAHDYWMACHAAKVRFHTFGKRPLFFMW